MVGREELAASGRRLGWRFPQVGMTQGGGRTRSRGHPDFKLFLGVLPLSG